MKRSFDVVVCGAGPAGCAAAVAARRSGLDTLLVEAQSAAGGVATSGMVSHWLGGRTEEGEWVVGGLFREFAEGAAAAGAAMMPSKTRGRRYHPYAWLPWFIHGVVLDPVRLPWYFDRVFGRERVEVLYETRVIGAEVSRGRIAALRLHNKGGISRVEAKAFIDATGDADVAALSGCRFFKGREEDGLTAPASLTFHLCGIDYGRLWSAIEKGRDPKFRSLIAELRKKGEWPFPYDIFITVKGLAEDEAMVNTMRLTGVDGTDAESRTRALVRGRDEAFALLEVFRRRFPGFARARMKAIAPMLGVRESRRIDGAFRLSVDDLRRGTVFPDTIGFSMYGWDLPDPRRPSVQPLVDESGGKFVNKVEKRPVTPIPYRVMVPRPVANLLVPGRAVSVERDVLGPLRVMAPVMAMGEAAGVAARQVAGGRAAGDVDVAAVRRVLRRRGCIVDADALPAVRPRRDP